MRYKVCEVKKERTGDGKPRAGKKLGEVESKNFPVLNSTIVIDEEEKRICFVEIRNSGERIIVVDDIVKEEISKPNPVSSLKVVAKTKRGRPPKKEIENEVKEEIK